MSDSFDGDEREEHPSRAPGGGDEWTTGAWGHRRATPQFVAPPPGTATGDSVLDLPDATPERRRAGHRSSGVHARRRRVGVVLALVVLLALGGGVYLGGRALIGQFTGSPAEDFAGGGQADVVIQVAQGDSAGAIGKTLMGDDVVASVAAFTNAAAMDSRMAAVQPGFYRLRTRLPASDAVARLVNPAARVGRMVIPEGRQLDDVKGATGTVTPGILSLIAAASCVELDGNKQCTSAQDLRAAAATAEPGALGVPDWAAAGVAAATKDTGTKETGTGDTASMPGAVTNQERRLEGLIRPGSYNIEPTAPATVLLKRLISGSATALQLTGLPQSSVAGLTPYQLLIVASLNEREVKPGEYAKVARVILNRLAIDQKLEFDSTVNYPLDVQAMATTPRDRATVTPWNTYASAGLPRTPIASPSDAAIAGALKPAVGNWHYFVTCGNEEATCFSDTYEQHLAVIAGGQVPS